MSLLTCNLRCSFSRIRIGTTGFSKPALITRSLLGSATRQRKIHQHFIGSLKKNTVVKRSLQRLTFFSEKQSCHIRKLWTQCKVPVKPGLGTTPLPLVGVCLGSGLALAHRSLTSGAWCKAKYGGRDRLVGVGSEAPTSDKAFDWKQLWELLSPDWLLLIGAIISAFAVALVNTQIPLLLGDVVNVISEFAVETRNDYYNLVKEPALKLLKMYAVQATLTFGYVSMLSSVGENMAYRLRLKLFSAIIQQDIAFFDSHKTGEIVNRLTADIQDFKSSFKMCISQGLRCLTQTMGCTVSLYLISPKLTVLMGVVIPSIILVGTFMGSGLRQLSRAAQAQVAKATAVADEAIGNVRTVRAFAMETKEKELYQKEIKRSSYLNTSLGLGIGLFQGLSNLALNGIVLGTLFFGGHMLVTQDIKAGDLMSFLAATQMIQRSLAQMSLLFGQAVKGISAGSRVFEYIKLESSMPLSGGKVIPYHSLIGNVEFKNVSFAYPTRKDQVVLNDLNLNVEGGKMVALCGLSGGGKSTVAALLERFYDVTNGQILLDGHDIRTLDPSWMRGRVIGFINQEPVLFATSVMENIRYGRPNATDEEVKAAAKLANADDFIRSFPDGYDTVLGERGTTVSGGQKQRIAIARALVKNPTIIILDEATSALDAESERIVQEALDRVVKGRTVIVIAHRLSTIRDADVIAVMSKGVVAEKGTHAELKKRKGLYWDLIRQQELEDEQRQPRSG